MQEFENIEEMIQHAKKKALRLLEVQDRTEQQLYQKLIEQGYPESVVEQAIFYVKSFHYIDDSRYAGNYVRYRQETKSKRQLKLELYKKGVPSDVVEQVLEEEYEGVSISFIWNAGIEGEGNDKGIEEFSSRLGITSVTKVD